MLAILLFEFLLVVSWSSTGTPLHGANCSQKQRVTQILYHLFINIIVSERLNCRKKATEILECFILRNDLAFLCNFGYLSWVNQKLSANQLKQKNYLLNNSLLDLTDFEWNHLKLLSKIVVVQWWRHAVRMKTVINNKRRFVLNLWKQIN